jgi:hypothetical protein
LTKIPTAVYFFSASPLSGGEPQPGAEMSKKNPQPVRGKSVSLTVKASIKAGGFGNGNHNRKVPILRGDATGYQVELQ